MSIGNMVRETRSKILNAALNPVREFVTDPVVKEACARVGHAWRASLWSPTLCLLACVWKQLQTTSARQVEDWIATLGLSESSFRDGKDFCDARKRLPFEVFYDVMQHVGRKATARSAKCFHSLPVWLMDGTTLRTPNTAANEAAFGRSKNKIRFSRSPILRLLSMVCAGCGAVLGVAIGGYRTSEVELLLSLLKQIPAGGLVLADRGLSSYLIFGSIRQRGAHLLTRYHATRRSRKAKSFGRYEWLEEWERPAPSHSTHPELLSGLPQTIEVRVITRVIRKRGYRDWTLKIVTTLTDRHTYPADELRDLYLQRWDIELDLRALKTHASMAQLTTKTPDLVRKEICSIMLAHNCVVAVMGDSGMPVRSLSHTRARQLLLTFAERMAAAPTIALPRLYRELLKLISESTLDQRKRAPQPRSLVQRASPYPVLMTSRDAWRRAQRVA